MKKLFLTALLTMAPMIYMFGDCTANQAEICNPCEQPAAEANTEKLNLFGFIKAEAFAVDRINRAPNGDLPGIFPPGIPYDDEKKFDHHQLILDARNSRLGVQALDTFCQIKMQATLEIDWATEDGNAVGFNSRHARLRHAFARADLPSGLFFLVGQTWTLMQNTDVPNPTIVSIYYLPGSPLSRQPQFRIGYKKHCPCLDGDLQFELDVEKHAFVDVNTPLALNVDPLQGCFQRTPAFLGRVSLLREDFRAFVTGAVGRSTTIFNDDKGNSANSHVWAFEGCASYRYCNLLLWGICYTSHGLNRFYSSYFLDQILSPSLRLHPFSSSGGTVGFRWDFIKNTLWFDALYGYARAVKPHVSDFNDNLQQTLQGFYVNVFYNFWKHWQVALEYERINVESFNHRKGHASGLYFSFNYYFGELGQIVRNG